MLKFYVSLRPVVIGRELLEPFDHLKHGFKGLDIKQKLVTCNRNVDGRYLYEIKIGEDSSYTSQQESDYKDILLEGLQIFSVHEKTASSAASLATTLSGVGWEVSGDSIIVSV